MDSELKFPLVRPPPDPLPDSKISFNRLPPEITRTVVDYVHEDEEGYHTLRALSLVNHELSAMAMTWLWRVSFDSSRRQ
jgi:hypothetical protein